MLCLFFLKVACHAEHPESWSWYFLPEESKDAAGRKINLHKQAMLQRFKPSYFNYFFPMQA